MRIPQVVTQIAHGLDLFLDAEAYLVGGASRNIVLGDDSNPKDYDIVVFNAYFSQICDYLRSNKINYSVGNENHYPFVSFTDEETGLGVEITVPRLGEDSQEMPFISLEDDAARRALTIDAIYYDIRNETIIDVTGLGVNDLRNNIARPCDINLFCLDINRIALVMVKCAKYHLNVSSQMVECANILRHRISDIPNEVLGNALIEAVNHDFLSSWFYLEDCGLLGLFPELEICYEYEQNNPHHLETLDTHLLRTLFSVKEISPDADSGLLLAALLHDVGKPETQDSSNGYATYHGHEKNGADIVRNMLQRLALPNVLVERVTDIVRNHMRVHELERNNSLNARSVKRLMNKLQNCELEDILVLSLADNRSRTPHEWQHKGVDAIRELISNGQLNPQEDYGSFVKGRHILEFTVLRPSPLFGVLLKSANEYHIDNPDADELECLTWALYENNQKVSISLSTDGYNEVE